MEENAVETSESELNHSLVELRRQLRDLVGKYPERLEPIRLAILKIRETGGADPLRCLKELAEAVIDVRKEADDTSKELRSLNIPPYLLFLPFKAGDKRPSDSVDLPEAAHLQNRRFDFDELWKESSEPGLWERYFRWLDRTVTGNHGAKAALNDERR
jgi:hypothetical protein